MLISDQIKEIVISGTCDTYGANAKLRRQFLLGQFAGSHGDEYEVDRLSGS